MKKLQVYALKEFIPPFLLSICVFTFVMLLDKLLDLLDMIVTKGVPLRTVAEIFLLLLPSMIAVVIPMAVLSGVLMAFGRMSGDLEITAMKASGVGILTPMLPVLAFAAVLAGVLVSFNNRILPNANHMARNLILDVGMLRPTARIIPGMFVDDMENLRILVGSKDDITGELRDVVIQQQVPGGPERTITATSGRMEPASGGTMQLVLRNGQMQELALDSICRTLDFEVYTLDVGSSDELTRHERENRGDREMSTEEMQTAVDSSEAALAFLTDSMRALGRGPLLSLESGAPIYTVDSSSASASSDPRTRFTLTRNVLSRIGAELRILRDRMESTRDTIGRFRVEIEKKISIPIACIIFVLLGVPLGISTRQGSAGIALALSLVFILVYYVFLIAGEQLADRGLIGPFVAMWAPNIVMGSLGIYLTARSIREGTPVRLPDLKPLLRRFSKDDS
jgi:lipopolysaccharide export system permease protein